MIRIQTSRIAAIALLSLCLSAYAEDNWDAKLATLHASHRAVEERVAQMLFLTPLLPAAAIDDQINAVIFDPDLSEPAREKILLDYAYQLRDLAPDPVALGGLQNLAAYTSRVLVPHPESRGKKLVPLFDVARAAEGTINQWLRESARARAAAELGLGSISFIEELTEAAHYQQIAGIADAVRVAPFSSVELLPDHLQQLLARSPQVTPIVLAAAYRLQDEGLLRLAIRSGGDISPAINKLLDFLPAEQAGTILIELATGKDSRLAGLAIAALARHAHSIEAAVGFLIATIGDRERGAAAALALAQIASPQVLADLAAVLKRPPDLLSQTRAALALKLNGSEPATALLRDFVQDHQGTKLAGEVQLWLH